ncbi:MAG: hypothetical protein FJY81_01110 [Candidatus Aminicenantes bacterium]|nr:hypothetical protein [Candidatus Aminicenantes bacterium]
MAEKPLNTKDSLTVIEEIEGKLEKILTKKKEEIEKELDERIRTIKEEAEKRIDVIEKELEKGRQILHDYRTVIGEYETERAVLQRQVREHFDKAVQYQTDIERMASLTLEELRVISELNKKLESLHQTAEEKVNLYKQDLEERFGIVAELPEAYEEGEEVKIDLEQELLKLRKIKQLLESEAAILEEEPVAEAGEKAAAPAVEPGEPQEPGAPATFPEINEVMESSLAEEAAAAEAVAEEGEAPAAGEKPSPEEKAFDEERESFRRLFEILEKYRRVEARNGNGEVCFFQSGDKCILDGEHIMASIDESLEEAKRLYLKLSQTESPKEQFFIKQEIINHQELLRKYLLRYVKMSEKEGATLPGFTEEILNLDVLKDILEKLSMENWSNPADFNAFRTHVEVLKDAFYAKITPPTSYLKALIDELES